jgi:hypothetical protein
VLKNNPFQDYNGFKLYWHSKGSADAHLDAMEGMVVVALHQTIAASQETPAHAILALVDSINLLAGNTETAAEEVAMAVVTQ